MGGEGQQPSIGSLPRTQVGFGVSGGWVVADPGSEITFRRPESCTGDRGAFFVVRGGVVAVTWTIVAGHQDHAAIQAGAATPGLLAHLHCSLGDRVTELGESYARSQCDDLSSLWDVVAPSVRSAQRAAGVDPAVLVAPGDPRPPLPAGFDAALRLDGTATVLTAQGIVAHQRSWSSPAPAAHVASVVAARRGAEPDGRQHSWHWICGERRTPSSPTFVSCAYVTDDGTATRVTEWQPYLSAHEDFLGRLEPLVALVEAESQTSAGDLRTVRLAAPRLPHQIAVSVTLEGSGETLRRADLLMRRSWLDAEGRVEGARLATAFLQALIPADPDVAARAGDQLLAGAPGWYRAGLGATVTYADEGDEPERWRRIAAYPPPVGTVWHEPEPEPETAGAAAADLQPDELRRGVAFERLRAGNASVPAFERFTVTHSADIGDATRGGPIDGLLDGHVFEAWETSEPGYPFAACVITPEPAMEVLVACQRTPAGDYVVAYTPDGMTSRQGPSAAIAGIEAWAELTYRMLSSIVGRAALQRSGAPIEDDRTRADSHGPWLRYRASGAAVPLIASWVVTERIPVGSGRTVEMWDRAVDAQTNPPNPYHTPLVAALVLGDGSIAALAAIETMPSLHDDAYLILFRGEMRTNLGAHRDLLDRAAFRDVAIDLLGGLPV